MSEITDYPRKVYENWAKCNRVVVEVIGGRKSLRFLSVKDKQQLLILETWSQRYKLPVAWIFEQLLRYYGFREGKWRMKGNLPASIQTLTAPSAEDILKQMIDEEFPARENVMVWRQREQDRILRDIMKEDGENVRRTPVDFNTREGFNSYYMRRIDRLRQREENLSDRLKKSRPYRGNPFR